MKKLLLATIITLLLLWCSHSRADTEIVVEVRSYTTAYTYRPYTAESYQFTPIYYTSDIHDAVHIRAHEHRLPDPLRYLPSVSELETVQYIRVIYREDDNGTD